MLIYKCSIARNFGKEIVQSLCVINFEMFGCGRESVRANFGLQDTITELGKFGLIKKTLIIC